MRGALKSFVASTSWSSLPKLEARTSEVAAKERKGDHAEAAAETGMTAETETTESPGDVRREGNFVVGTSAQITGKRNIASAAGARSEIDTAEKDAASNAATEATSRVIAGRGTDLTARPLDPLTRATGEAPAGDHVAEVGHQAELLNAIDAVRGRIPLTTAMKSAVADATEVLSTSEAESTIAADRAVERATQLPILVRVPPDHPQGKNPAEDRDLAQSAAVTADQGVEARSETAGTILKITRNSRTRKGATPLNA